jgi:hypothetical protein
MKTTIGMACVSLLALCIGCSPSGNAEGPTGEVELALSLPDGTSVTSVSWKILSASNATLVSGTLNTSGSQRPSFIASLVAGTGDTVSMDATTSTGVSCTGKSAPFDVVAGQAVNVAVNVLCGGTSSDAGIGSVVVSGTIVAGDHCPTLTSWLVSPQAAAAPDPIDVTVGASDQDTGDTLSYAWSATAGTFTTATSATTQYHCAATGSQTLTVQVTDNHTPTPCTTSIAFPTVDCL